MTTKRVNFFIETDILEVIDAFALMNNRSRTHVLNELLRPSLPALKQLLVTAETFSTMSDAERLSALKRLSDLEDLMAETAGLLPAMIEGVSK